MNTLFLLMAQYDGAAVIPLDRVQKDYFSHLDLPQFQARLLKGQIRLPVVRIDPNSQKSARGVAIEDLAEWIDARKQAARKELRQIAGEAA